MNGGAPTTPLEQLESDMGLSVQYLLVAVSELHRLVEKPDGLRLLQHDAINITAARTALAGLEKKLHRKRAR